MSNSDKDKIQQILLDTLSATRRRAFRGNVAVRISLYTTDRNPTQSHHVAKNLLDLFGAPTHLKTRRSGLLYYDDRQVHALSVSASHGNDEPSIHIEVQSLTDFLEDVRLAAEVQQDDDDSFRYDEPQESINDFRQMCLKPDRWKQTLGSEAGYSLMLRFNQRNAQEALFGEGALSISDINNMYNVRHFGPDSRAWFQDMFAALPLRMKLSGLPQVPGSGHAWRSEIDNKIDAFLAKWGDLLTPLVTPIAVEVVIKPPPGGRNNALFDLDNVMRTYVLPRIVGKLKPVSHPSFIFNEESEHLAALQPDKDVPMFPMPPKSSRFGVTRYEAWRLPPATSVEDAFVTVAIVADLVGLDDVFGRVSERLDEWDELDED